MASSSAESSITHRSEGGAGGPLPSAPLDTLWPQRDRDAVQAELVRRFLPLARRLAHRYRSPHEPFEDLVQVASLGLLGAISRFDPSRGKSFESFAIPTILGELRRHFRSTGWALHVPRGAQEMSLRINRAVRALTAATGRSPRVSAIAEYLGVSIEDVLLGLEAAAAHYTDSLDRPVADSDLPDPLLLGDCLGSDDERLALVETTASLHAIFAQLPHLERRALTLRMQDGMRQIDIARLMGCSQMQVSRLLRRAAARTRALTDPSGTELNGPPPSPRHSASSHAPTVPRTRSAPQPVVQESCQ